MKTILYFLVIFSLQSTRADIAELPDFYYWKNSYVELKTPSIVGKWLGVAELGESNVYIFKANGVCKLYSGKEVVETAKWKQRKNGQVYLEMKPAIKKGAKRYTYVGYVKKNTFIRDEFCYVDKYKKM